tara:strand:- start:1692 stop:2105 length:414 start_codon:yes stop_codon:yes gene_type:complete
MRYLPPERIASVTELRDSYREALKEIKTLRQAARNERYASQENRKEALEGRKTVKKLNKDIVTLTKKEQAAEEASKCGYWSGGATVCVTMLYEAWRIVGFPGGREWAAWWEHEALYGAICFITTMTFASFHKAFHGK